MDKSQGIGNRTYFGLEHGFSNVLFGEKHDPGGSDDQDEQHKGDDFGTQ
jgi:hypothetical protein